MQFLLNRLLGLGIGTVALLICLGVYNSYKYLCWPQVQAVVTSIEPICVYTKKTGRRSRTKRRLSCNGGAEADKAVADGYKLQRYREALIRAAYEVEPGRETFAVLRPEWEDVASLRPGSVIQIRYSPISPNEAEMATRADKVILVVLGFLLAAVVLACLLAVLTYDGDEPAKSSS